MYIYIYHNSFIHSTIDGHLGSFHVLAIINSSAMNFEVHISFQTVFPEYTPGVWLLYHILALLLVIKRASILLSIVVVPVYIPTNSVERVPFSPCPIYHLLSAEILVMALLTDMKSYLTIVLICISLIISNLEHLFVCLLAMRSHRVGHD